MRSDQPVQTHPPAKQKQPAPTSKTPVADQVQQVYDACIEKANRHDVGGIVGCFAPNGTSAMSDGGTDRGRDKIRDSMITLWKGIPDMTRLPQIMLFAPGGRTTATLVLETATHKGPIGPLAATGRRLGMWGVQLINWTADNLIASNVHTFDQATVLAQLGVIKIPHRPVASALWGKPIVVKATGSATEKRNLAKVTAMTNGMTARKLDVMQATLAGDVAFHNLGGPSDIHGLANVVRFFELILRAFPDMKIDQLTAFAAGDWVFVYRRWQGTNTGPSQVLGVAKPTGRRVTYHTAEFYRFDNGRVNALWSVNDRLHIIQQLRLLGARSTANPKRTP